ncbi:MAG: hypothetical protein QM784_10625 [Polyangiaceae bacterium]
MKPVDQNVLNVALDFALEFGPNWLAPVQNRLATQFPSLAPAELDKYDLKCREVMRYGHQLVPSVVKTLDCSTEETFARYSELMRQRYDWISESNLQRLFSQGCYYALEIAVET